MSPIGPFEQGKKADSAVWQSPCYLAWAGTPKNLKGDKTMSNVLMLQRLHSNTSSSEFTNLFGSAVSTVCPEGPGSANSPFQME